MVVILNGAYIMVLSIDFICMFSCALEHLPSKEVVWNSLLFQEVN